MKISTSLRVLSIGAGCLGLLLVWTPSASGQPKLAQKESNANIEYEPKQILRTGIDLCESGLSSNSLQVAEVIGLTPILERLESLRIQAERAPEGTLERVTARQDLFDAVLKAGLLIQKANLEIDFTLAEIEAEQMVYSEILDSYYDARDRALAKTNALSFMSNGALWAVCEGLAIPTFKHPKYAVPSGITGILAGLIPSAASMYTLKQVGGKKKTSEVEPNMLAKLFDYPTTIDIEYPKTVWTFLTQVPANEPKGKTRRDQLIDSWVADANIKAFNDRRSRKQIDIITASVPHKGGLSIETLEIRTTMLQKLTGEIMKMKRMLLELTMAIQGEKSFTAYGSSDKKNIGGTKSGVTY
jgi:hypothetical protein